MSISKRFKLSAFLVVFIAVLGFVFGITYETNRILDEQRTEIQQHVDMVYGILVYYNDMVLKGTLTKEEAQKEARDIVRSMNYANGGYFWIHNTDCVLIMHPVNPEYEGQYRCDFTDKNGKFYYREFQEKVHSPAKSGFVKYEGPKAAGKSIRERVNKVSYVRGFEAWGWVIGTGFYEDDVYNIIRDKCLFYGSLYGLCFAFMFIFMMSHTSITLKVVPEFKKAMDRILAGRHDFEVAFTERDDEYGDMAKGLEKIRVHMKGQNIEAKTTFFDKDYFLKP